MSAVLVSSAIALADKLLGLGDKLIEDKDKKAEFAAEVFRLTNTFSTEVLKTSTVPWVDATVKILYALRDVVIPLLRPVVSGVMTMIGIYMEYKQIPLSPVAESLLIGAFPGWGVSRHVGKAQEVKAETTRTVEEARTTAILQRLP